MKFEKFRKLIEERQKVVKEIYKQDYENRS